MELNLRRLLIKFIHGLKENPKNTVIASLTWLIRIPYYYFIYPIILSQNVIKTNRSNINALSEELDVLIVSPGGVATTFLLRYVSKFMKTNDINDADGLKHIIPAADFKFRKNLKVIYLTGDLPDIEQSLVKRGWLFEQYIKLGGNLSNFYKSKEIKRHFRDLASNQLKIFELLSSNSSI